MDRAAQWCAQWCAKWRPKWPYLRAGRWRDALRGSLVLHWPAGGISNWAPHTFHSRAFASSIHLRLAPHCPALDYKEPAAERSSGGPLLWPRVHCARCIGRVEGAFQCG